MIGKEMMDLDFKSKTYTPWDHQKRAWEFLKSRPVAALFMRMRSGKTMTMVVEAAARFMAGQISGVVVVCPNTIKGNWADEVKIHSPVEAKTFIQSPEKFGRGFGSAPKQLEYFMVAHESLSHSLMSTARAMAQKFAERHSRKYGGRGLMVIVDEGHNIKNHKSIRYKAEFAIGQLGEFRRILTGTPMAKGLEDLYTQYNFLEPRILDYPNFFAYRNTFCIRGGFKGKQIVGYMNQDHLNRKVQKYTFRVRDEELDLPEKIRKVTKLELPDGIRKAYTTMKDELFASIGKESITVNIAITQLLRLRQILGGYIPFEDGSHKVIPGENTKLDEIERIVTSTDEKVVVWCDFRPEIELVKNLLLSLKISPQVVHGGVKPQDRMVLIREFNENPKSRVFVGMIETAKEGVKLSSSSVAIYYSNTLKRISREQSEDRILSVNDGKKGILLNDLVYRGTVEARLLSLMMKRGKAIEEMIPNMTIDAWDEFLSINPLDADRGDVV